MKRVGGWSRPNASPDIVPGTIRTASGERTLGMVLRVSLVCLLPQLGRLHG